MAVQGLPGVYGARRSLMFELGRGKYFRYVILAPAMLIIFFFALFPLFYTLRLSFMNQVLTNPTPPTFVGLANYRRALNDPMFCRLWDEPCSYTRRRLPEMLLGTLIAFCSPNPLADGDSSGR